MEKEILKLLGEKDGEFFEGDVSGDTIRGCRIKATVFFAKKNKSRASQSPALGVRFKYEQKQNLTERLYLIFSVLSNQTSTGS